MLTQIGTVEDVRPGNARRVELDGLTIAVFNVEGTFYAIEDECPHEEGGSLARGSAKGRTAWCPLHGAGFDLVTGRTIDPPEGEAMGPPVDRGVRAYTIVTIDANLYVDL